MKKISTYILLFLTLAVMPVCGQQYFLSTVSMENVVYLNVDETNARQSFGVPGGVKLISISSNLQLTASCSQPWCKTEIIEQNAEKQVRITAGENKEAHTREAVVTIAGKDNMSAQINIIQIGTAPVILVKEQNIEIVDDNYAFSLEITTNRPIDIVVPEWISKVDAAPAAGLKQYKFAAAEYLDKETPRRGNIVVKDTEGLLADVAIPVVQIFRGYPRVAVISDIHFENNKGEGAKVKSPKAVRNLISKGIDALFICGDLTDWGTVSQWQLLKNFLSDIPAEVPVYVMMGNHDHYDNAGAVCEQRYKEYTGQPLHQYIDIKGYPFITLSMNGTSWNSYSDECIAFLKESLEDAAEKYAGKPIFVMTHVPPKGTVYGSNSNDGNWGTDKYESVLKNYPQVIIFSGHSHYPLGDPRSIHQNIYTAVNDGSTTYSEIENKCVDAGIHPENYEYVTEGLIVNLDRERNVIMERWDTYRNEEIAPRWQVKAPHDGTAFLYKNRKSTTPPVFSPGAKPVVSEIKDSSCKVTFPQASETLADVVHHYKIEILEGTAVKASFKKFSEYYLNSDKPEKFTITMTGLPAGSHLKARVKAVDAYFNESVPIESEAFTTAASTP